MAVLVKLNQVLVVAVVVVAAAAVVLFVSTLVSTLQHDAVGGLHKQRPSRPGG